MDSDRRYSFFIISFIVLISLVAIYLTKEFVPVVVFSIFLTYILYPVYEHILKLTKNEKVASSVSVLSALLIFGFCLYLLISSASREITKLILSPERIKDPIIAFEERLLDIINTTDYLSFIVNSYFSDGLSQSIITAMNWLSPYAKNSLATIVGDGPLYAISFVLMLMFTYYFLMDAQDIKSQFLDIFPEIYRTEIDGFIKELNSIYYGLFNVFFVTSFLTGVIASVGFIILGISYPVILGIGVFLLTLLPVVGAPVIYGPLFIYYLILQEYVLAFVLLMFGVLILSIFPDSYIRPRLAKSKASIHPVITLISFTAPIFVIGFTGFIIGPLVYGFLLAFYRIKLKNKKQKSNDF